MVERVREDGVDGVVEGVRGEWWKVCGGGVGVGREIMRRGVNAINSEKKWGGQTMVISFSHIGDMI